MNDDRIIDEAKRLFERKRPGERWEDQSDADIRALYITRAQRSLEPAERPQP